MHFERLDEVKKVMFKFDTHFSLNNTCVVERIKFIATCLVENFIIAKINSIFPDFR